MAGFRMHVSTSTVLGCGYAGVLHLGYGVPPDTAVVAGAMCGFSGMLPDLDSDYGVPLRETMAFTAATIPDAAGRPLSIARTSATTRWRSPPSGMYLFMRFGVTNMIRKYTVHRGMFHSIPAMLIFAGLAFLVCGASPIDVRCYKAGGVMGGFMSHLMLDEIYAVEFKGGRWRLKKSFGTAIKFWGDDRWSNFSTYAKLAIVGDGDSRRADRDAAARSRINPQFAGQINDLQQSHRVDQSKFIAAKRIGHRPRGRQLLQRRDVEPESECNGHWRIVRSTPRRRSRSMPAPRRTISPANGNGPPPASRTTAAKASRRRSKTHTTRPSARPRRIRSEQLVAALIDRDGNRRCTAIRRESSAGIGDPQASQHPPYRSTASPARRSRATPACARETRRWPLRRPASRTLATNASYSRSANSGGAASVKLGRRPLRQSP